MSYLKKDMDKFSVCNKLITRGAIGSSSDKYKNPKILGLNLEINSNNYTDIDIVGVSVNGRRSNRISFSKNLVKLAIESGAMIVKDNDYHTNRSFNIGERELEAYLIQLGATKIKENNLRSIWRKV